MDFRVQSNLNLLWTLHLIWYVRINNLSGNFFPLCRNIKNWCARLYKKIVGTIFLFYILFLINASLPGRHFILSGQNTNFSGQDKKGPSDKLVNHPDKIKVVHTNLQIMKNMKYKYPPCPLWPSIRLSYIANTMAADDLVMEGDWYLHISPGVLYSQ